MRIDNLSLEVEPIADSKRLYHGNVDVIGWRTTCVEVRKHGGRLVALWASDRGESPQAAVGKDRFEIHAALALASQLVWITHRIHGDRYPDVADLFPAATRMQRAAFDMIGVHADPVSDTRPWLRHGAWPRDRFPLRKDFGAGDSRDARTQRPAGAGDHRDARTERPFGAGDHREFDNLPDNYYFVRVEGDGVHEIPVGPVHAGTIEPGHFRFSVLGERVLRLEERLGYKHKGIEKRFEQMTLTEGARLAGRISGDATVSYAWAYAAAVEMATGCICPPRASWLRALFLERERLANHLGDLGFLGNDAGFAFGFSQFSRLKEDVLRSHADLFGHRYLMDAIVPGGVAHDIDGRGMSRMSAQCHTLLPAITELHQIYDDHAGVQDRFNTTGIVTPTLALRLGLTGLAGRASGQAFDARIQHPPFPYDALDVKLIVHKQGDVAARVRQRFEEAVESIRLCEAIIERLPVSPLSVDVPELDRDAIGAGFVESWRGPVFIALEASAGNRIHRLHAHDPSWENWPLIEHAVIGNIVPDFPLINKSFNLGYSGHDL